MKKQEFLAELWKQLSDAPKEDVERSLDYYTEMIEDRIEAGMSEEEAVADIGSPKDAAKQIMDELPKTRPAGVFRDRTAETAGSGSSQVQSGPVHSGQVQSGPAQSGPVKSGPVQGGPAQNRSAGNASAYAGSRNTAEYNAAYDEQMDRMMNRTPEKPQKKSSAADHGCISDLRLLCYALVTDHCPFCRSRRFHSGRDCRCGQSDHQCDPWRVCDWSCTCRRRVYPEWSCYFLLYDLK